MLANDLRFLNSLSVEVVEMLFEDSLNELHNRVVSSTDFTGVSIEELFTIIKDRMTLYFSVELSHALTRV